MIDQDEAALAQFFAGRPEARALFAGLLAAVAATGPVRVRVSKSQVALERARTLARVWLPDQYLGPGHAPLVLTVGLRRRDGSPRWKQVVEVKPGRFTHHLELRSATEIDAEVLGWLAEAEQA